MTAAIWVLLAMESQRVHNLENKICQIKGVREATAKALVKQFKDEQHLREANLEALMEVNGVGNKLAKRIKEAL